MISRQSGFTLLEVMAAFVVFALVFATSLQVLSGAMRNTSRAEQFTKAALLAQSRMDLVGIDPPVEAGNWSGTFDDQYAWEIDIVPFEADIEGSLVEIATIELFQVNLTVLWGEAIGQPRRAVFQTLRSAPVEP